MPRLLLCATLAAPLALSLAACDRSGNGTTVTINADDGSALGSINAKSGEVKLALPGFSGQFKMPKVQMNAENFDLNGVHLYPGSTIENVNIGTGGKDADGGLHLAFTSPASAVTVRDWFDERLGNAGFTVTQSGDGLVGTTDEGKPFRLDLNRDGDGRARGTIVLGS